ncbi:hypothetical protein ACGF12_35760 [Kitasatospora sp. NPDC048296]
MPVTSAENPTKAPSTWPPSDPTRTSPTGLPGLSGGPYGGTVQISRW